MPSSNIADGPQPLAVALGDPAGVGPEITAKAWEQRRQAGLPPFFAVGDIRSVEAVWRGPVVRIFDPADAVAAFDTALPLIQVEGAGDIVPGTPNLSGARCALDSLELAVGLTRTGGVSGLVTGPVAKAQLYDIGFTHPGQTEFVAERCGIARDRAVMMLAGPTLRTVPITIHLPLKDVPDALTTALIVTRAQVTERGLRRDFGIDRPRLAIAGLNPHAGEHGALGREEIDIIVPAVEQLRAEGIAIVGPASADTMFHPRARAQFDAALCPYHDQALIPIKTLHFDDGVNVTLGLPIVRTSPDHGTAFGLAGQDRADPGAMIAAIRMAGTCAAHRARAG
jgi:4-hydroxythreonine-4-phosphate dehydrogenase